MYAKVNTSGSNLSGGETRTIAVSIIGGDPVATTVTTDEPIEGEIGRATIETDDQGMMIYSTRAAVKAIAKEYSGGGN